MGLSSPSTKVVAGQSNRSRLLSHVLHSVPSEDTNASDPTKPNTHAYSIFKKIFLTVKIILGRQLGEKAPIRQIHRWDLSPSSFFFFFVAPGKVRTWEDQKVTGQISSNK